MNSYSVDHYVMQHISEMTFQKLLEIKRTLWIQTKTLNNFVMSQYITPPYPLLSWTCLVLMNIV